ncbi:MAG: hypothetical protein AB7S97_02270 [Thermoplasmata archaeon]
MASRWNPVSMRAMTAQAVVKDDLRRRTSGFRYWLLLPLTWLLMYVAIIWFIFVLLWPSEGLRERFGRRPRDLE